MLLLLIRRGDGHNLFEYGSDRFQQRAAGVIIDGGTRDYSGLQDDRFQDFPVLHKFTDPHTTSWLGCNTMLLCALVALPYSWNIVVGDDGVFFLPPSLVDTVLVMQI